MILLSPSILSANFATLGEDIKLIEETGVDMLHIDVMDGCFVPNLTFGAPIISSIKKITNLPLDVHLMISEPSRYIDDYIFAGADILTIHVEADKHVDRTIRYIKSKGIKASLAFNPGTPLTPLKYLASSLDMVLIMTVNPGFGGQSLIDYSHDKIKEARLIAEKENKALLIEVDGGIDETNIISIVQSGANVIVAGSSIFKNRNINGNLNKLKEVLKNEGYNNF
ncbi:MAG TPA: ribulose-phosphate 3-epimerase [Clostridiaceae bacterium]